MDSSNEFDDMTANVELEAQDALVHLDAKAAWDRNVTILRVGVDGLVFAVAATGEHGVQVETIDYRNELEEQNGASYVAFLRSVRSVGSFLDELGRRPLDPERSTLTASEESRQILAVYDDHVNGRAGRRADMLRLHLRLHEDWAAWHQFSGTQFDQQAFGDLLEELIHNVVVPAQADLLEVVDTIRMSSNATFEGSINRANGSQSVVYKEENTATAGAARTLAVPQTITLRLPVFEGYPVEYEVQAWFRIATSNGKLRLSVKLKPTRRVYLAAWADVQQEIVETLAERTGHGFTILDA